MSAPIELDNVQREAIEEADAELSSAGLPTYTDLLAALNAATGELQ